MTNVPAGWPSLRSNYVTTNEVTEDLTRRWARGPANLLALRQGVLLIIIGIRSHLGVWHGTVSIHNDCFIVLLDEFSFCMLGC